jgi:hypothetical protein
MKGFERAFMRLGHNFDLFGTNPSLIERRNYCLAVTALVGAPVHANQYAMRRIKINYLFCNRQVVSSEL